MLYDNILGHYVIGARVVKHARRAFELPVHVRYGATSRHSHWSSNVAAIVWTMSACITTATRVLESVVMITAYPFPGVHFAGTSAHWLHDDRAEALVAVPSVIAAQHLWGRRHPLWVALAALSGSGSR